MLDELNPPPVESLDAYGSVSPMDVAEPPPPGTHGAMADPLGA